MGTLRGSVVLEKAPTFKLQGITGKYYDIDALCERSNLMLAFYPGGTIKPVCSSQFCDYRDNFEMFKPYNLLVIGISNDSIERQLAFAEKNEYPFLFLSDPRNSIAKAFNANSSMMLGHTSRAIFIINQKRVILYRYIEPTYLTMRGSEEIVTILEDMKNNKIL